MNIEPLVGGLVDPVYGLFLVSVVVFLFLDLDAVGAAICLLAPFELESDDEFFRLARRFIQLVNGRRRECRSIGPVSLQPM